MRILVFSDTHLSKFDIRKYNFLKKIVSDSDRVIINGDFIEEWLISGEEFIKSEWKKLFPTLLEKETVYVKGNHEESISQDVAKNFSVKCCSAYKEILDGKSFQFEPGHRIREENESNILKLYRRILSYNFKLLRIFVLSLSNLFYTLFPKLSEKITFGKKQNNVLKNYYKERDFFLIVGDTHIPELDLEKSFANTGKIMKDRASYLVINNGIVELIKTRY